MFPFRIGQGFDVHALVPGRRLILGGVHIPFELGLLGHSDADVLLHTVTDAILGAAGLGDIGRHFPDTDVRFAGADSRVLLREAFARDPGRFASLGRGPVCVRAYWGEYVSDRSYYVYLRAIPGGFVVTDVVFDTGFGPALAGVFAVEHHPPAVSEFDRCMAANAAATP